MPDFDCDIPALNASSADIRHIIKTSKIVAVVGLSPNPDRPSHEVAQYLQLQNYKIIPVNPGHSELLGEPCYKRLGDVPGPVDIVDIFRRSEAVPEIVDDAIAKKVRCVWMQLGVINNEAAQKARAAGILVVMNKCLLVEHQSN